MIEIRQISVIGAGLMGHAIALEFALHGFPVRLYDESRERVSEARTQARRTAAPLLAAGLIDATELENGLARLYPSADLRTVCSDADYVVEAVPENLEIKRQVFAQLDDRCPPHTIFASNTSSIPPSLLAAATRRPDRVLVAHYFNPPHLIPVVELVLGAETSAETAQGAAELLRRIGKSPALVRKEVPGFIANRLQAALLREALALVEAGVADVEDIDAVVRQGFGRRLAVFGPFAVSDLAGLDVWAAIAAGLFPELSSSSEVPALLADHVAAGRLGAKSGAGFYPWPDERLNAALARRDAELVRGLQADAAHHAAGPAGA